MHQSEIFITDAQLQARWHCSHMKLWRLRKDGQLPAPIKIGGGRSNLTPMEAVVRGEATVTEKAA
jgi:predicted DNA-binding transcriptional regulator AlpA